MIKRIACTAVLLSVVISGTAYAQIDSCAVNSETDRVSVKGTVDPNEDVLLTVVRKDAGEDDFFDKMAYQYQTKSGNDGSYTFEFKMADAAIYTVYAATADTTDTYDFVFTNKESAKSVIERINAAGSAAEIERIIRGDRYAAGLFAAECDAEPDYNYIAGMMSRAKPYSASEIDRVLNDFKQYLLYGYIYNGSIDNLFKFDKDLNISQIADAAIFTSDMFKESHQLETSKRLVGKSFANRGEFENILTEQMALSVIMNPDGYGNIEKICKSFAVRIGIDTANTSSSVYRDLYGKSFSDFEELKKKFNELKNTSKPIGGGGGSSGGGGGGGGSKPAGSSGGIISSSNNDIPERLPIIAEKTSVFDDLDGYSWAEEAIEALYKKGIISGRTDRSYAPSENITRSEFVKLVVLAFNIADGGGRIPFTDIREDSWDYDYIRIAYNAGIINGISSVEFGSGMPISRQDMAVIIQRASGIGDVDTDLAEKFADDWRISNYAYNAAYSLKDKGIMVGDDNNMFNPKNTATRAEAAKVIYTAAK